MNKDIKDYLHLYLGCMVQHPALSNPRELTASWMVSLIDKGIEVKPILRPLSDMTEEECLRLCEFTSPTIFGDFRYKKWKVIKEREWDETQKNYAVKREGDEHSFTIDCIDGDIFLWCDDEYIDAPYMNFNYRFELLKMEFDLFGLIDEGLAIDKTKLLTNK